MMQYNAFVKEVFSHPQHVLATDLAHDGLVTAQAGARLDGVWFQLFFDTGTQRLFYKVYGSPYAIAAVEWLAREVAAKRVSLNSELEIESIRQALEMPFPYMNILLTLEDAWRMLVSKP